MVFIKNKPGTKESVWIGGITVKELKSLNIPYSSRKDWGNWEFSIPRSELKKLKL